MKDYFIPSSAALFPPSMGALFPPSMGALFPPSMGGGLKGVGYQNSPILGA